MGGRQSPDYSQDEREIRAIKKAIELGMTHIDTAEFYADGHAVEMIFLSPRRYGITIYGEKI